MIGSVAMTVTGHLGGSLFPGLANPSSQAATLVMLGLFFFIAAGMSFLWQGIIGGRVMTGFARTVNRRAWMFFAAPGFVCLFLALMSVLGMQSAVVWLVTAPPQGGLNLVQDALVSVYFALILILIILGPREVARRLSDLVKSRRGQ